MVPREVEHLASNLPKSAFENFNLGSCHLNGKYKLPHGYQNDQPDFLCLTAIKNMH